MATGKTNARWIRCLVDGYDLSGFARNAGTIGSEYASDDATGYGDGVRNVTLGTPTFPPINFQALFATDGTDDTHDALATLSERELTIAIGIKAAPAIGDPCYAGQFEQRSYQPEGSGAIAVTAVFEKATTNASAEKPWGVLLAAGASISATTDHTIVDNGASSANGCIAILHITASSGGTWALVIEHSATGAWGGEEATLITFSANGSAITSEAGTASGTVNQYVRLAATRTSGSITPWVSFIRL